jgi:hypothetical protein
MAGDMILGDKKCVQLATVFSADTCNVWCLHFDCLEVYVLTVVCRKYSKHFFAWSWGFQKEQTCHCVFFMVRMWEVVC